MQCGFCGGLASDSPRSHIVPEALGRYIQADSKALLAIPTRDDLRPGLVHSFGVWDRIVCATCEGRFHEADDYFIRFYQRRDDCIHRGSLFAYPNADASLLQRFFLTCLFRAHLSHRQEFQRIDLGPYATKFIDALSGPARIVAGLDVFLIRQTHVLSNMIGIQPRGMMGEIGLVCYQVYVPGFTGVIKVDNRRPAAPWSRCCLGAQATVIAANGWRPGDGILHGLHHANKNHGHIIERISSSLQAKPQENKQDDD